MTANDPLKLLALLQPRKKEMARNLEFQARDPKNFGTGATQADLADASDPVLDPMDTARVDDTQNQLHDAATFNRPEVAGVRNEKETNALRRLLLPVQAKAQADSQQDNEKFAQQLMRDRMNNADVADRQTAQQHTIDARTGATQAAQGGRQIVADKLMRARKLDDSVNKGGVWDWLTGAGKQNQSKADALRGSAGVQSGSAQEAALLLSQKFPGAALEDLISQGEVSVDTPEEMQQLQQAFAALQDQGQ